MYQEGIRISPSLFSIVYKTRNHLCKLPRLYRAFSQVLLLEAIERNETTSISKEKWKDFSPENLLFFIIPFSSFKRCLILNFYFGEVKIYKIRNKKIEKERENILQRNNRKAMNRRIFSVVVSRRHCGGRTFVCVCVWMGWFGEYFLSDDERASINHRDTSPFHFVVWGTLYSLVWPAPAGAKGMMSTGGGDSSTSLTCLLPHSRSHPNHTHTHGTREKKRQQVRIFHPSVFL